MAANAIVGVAVHHSKDGVGPLVLSQLIRGAQKVDPDVSIPNDLEFAVSGWASAVGQGKGPKELESLWEGLMGSAREQVASSRRANDWLPVNHSSGSRRPQSRRKKKGKAGKKKKGKAHAPDLKVVEEDADAAGDSAEDPAEDAAEAEMAQAQPGFPYTNSECPICLDDFDTTSADVAIVGCEGNHGVCEGCLKLWFHQCVQTGVHTTCPLCRESVPVAL